VNTFDVRIHAIRRRRNRRRPFEVRWHAAGRPRSRSFATRGLADSYRAELVRAARRGVEFGHGTGEPACWAARPTAAVNWHEHAAAYAAMKWPQVSAHTRAGIADALATITPVLTAPGTDRPPTAALRAALYGWAFNPGRPGPGPAPPIAADEEVRGMPPRPAPPVMPVQPKRLRRHRADGRVEIHQHQVVPLQPRLEPDMSSGRREIPPAREAPQTLPEMEGPNWQRILEPLTPARRKRLTAPDTLCSLVLER